nr:RNA-directed DNA polymerase, eukaryota [Tanacetum cinerariifolium]
MFPPNSDIFYWLIFPCSYGEVIRVVDETHEKSQLHGSSSHTVESANNVDDQFSTRSIENIQKKKESGSILEILKEMISVGQTMCFSMEGSIKDMERIIDLKGADDVKKKESGSILEILEEMILVGQTMGFSMKGSIKDMERIIDLKGGDDVETKAENVSNMEIKSLWGNTNFDAIVSQSLDFNEVRRTEERWGSTFNVYGARDFNQFITSFGLVEVQFEGYSYTWAHPSAYKMSKLDRFLVSDGFLSLFPHTSAVCLDRHLSDHRPILL